MAGSNFKDFDAEIAERELGDPVSFQLGGVLFHCKNPMPLGSILVMARHANDESAEAQQKQAQLLWDFIEPEQHADLDEVITNVSDITVIPEIIEYILSESTGRPIPGS